MLLFTRPLTQNHEFRRLYYRGKCASCAALAVYCLKNKLGYNRLGLTVGSKLGCAVVRNRTRRRLRECYRLHERELKAGYDIVIVARNRAVTDGYAAIERDLCAGLARLGILTSSSQ